jgi:hypothetical protein
MILKNLEQIRIGRFFRIASPDVEKPRELTPTEKIALDRKNEYLTQKAESRQEECWSYGCTRKATVWVREVGFDFKGSKADPLNHIAVSSADYVGPVPGFCTFCLGSGPAKLAEAVYFSRPEMVWGVRPNRWFVSFTDGTRQGGMAIALDPKGQMPNILLEGTK